MPVEDFRPACGRQAHLLGVMKDDVVAIDVWSEVGLVLAAQAPMAMIEARRPSTSPSGIDQQPLFCTSASLEREGFHGLSSVSGALWRASRMSMRITGKSIA